MDRAARPPFSAATESPSGHRAIGPIGTVSRVCGGLAAIFVPIAIYGITWWDLAAALVVLPLIATGVVALVSAGSKRYPDVASDHRESTWSGFGVLVGVIVIVIAIATALTFVTPVDGVAIWAWLGASMLLAAVRGDAGCEVLAFPNAIRGRRDEVGCILYTPIDALEERLRSSRA
jgi:hypothetical protein